jgi:hypothetical protein
VQPDPGKTYRLACDGRCGVDPVRLQRVVSSMMRFGLLPKNTNFQITSMITG